MYCIIKYDLVSANHSSFAEQSILRQMRLNKSEWHKRANSQKATLASSILDSLALHPLKALPLVNNANLRVKVTKVEPNSEHLCCFTESTNSSGSIGIK